MRLENGEPRPRLGLGDHGPLLIMNRLVNYSDSSEDETQMADDSSRSATETDSMNHVYTEFKTSPAYFADYNYNLPRLHNHNQNERSAQKRLKKNEDLESSLKCLVDRQKIPEKAIKDELSVPRAIHSMFTDSESADYDWQDDPAKHGHRVRSFPHVQGNWATHVFIPVDKDERLMRFVCQLLNVFEPLSFVILPEFHISLSRTVVVRHHWIEPLVDSLKDGLSPQKSCIGDLEEIKVYTNDEKTRSFLCIEVSKEDTAFSDYASIVDKCFDGFKLPRYYEDPSFHISVAWCLGDVCDSVSKDKLRKAKELLGCFCSANPELSVVFARNICCRSGNKSYFIPLIV